MALDGAQWWRNVGRRLGVLRLPAAEVEPSEYLPPGEMFQVLRIAAVGGLRYLQLADGRGWVPERSRKDPLKVVVELVEQDRNEYPVKSGGDDESAFGSGDEESAAVAGASFSADPVRVRYLRLSVFETRSASDKSLSTQIAEIRLRCRGELLSLEGFVAESPCGRSPPREGPEKVLSSARGKWLDLLFRENGQSVLLLSAPEEVEVDDLAFLTASDAPGRDPVNIRVDGSRDGWEWMVLHESGAEMGTTPVRNAWSSWLYLWPDPRTLAHCLQGNLGVARPACDEPGTYFDYISAQLCPEDVSWWCNLGDQLSVIVDPLENTKVVGYVAPGTFFACVCIATFADQPYLQLPGGRGWVPVCSPEDPSLVIVERVERQAAPSSVAATSVSAPHVQVRMRYLRLVVLSTRSDNAVSTEITQVSLRSRGEVLSLDGFTAENPGGQCPLNEGPEKVLGPKGKWLDFNFCVRKESVLLLKAPEEIDIDSFAFCTSGHQPARDPVSFRIDGSEDGEKWSVLFATTASFLSQTSKRGTWTPWLQLCTQCQAPEVAKPDGSHLDVVRHRCCVAGCLDLFAVTEGYVVQGKLLRHMLQEHAGEQATLDLQVQLSDGGASRCKSASMEHHRSMGCSPSVKQTLQMLRTMPDVPRRSLLGEFASRSHARARKRPRSAGTPTAATTVATPSADDDFWVAAGLASPRTSASPRTPLRARARVQASLGDIRSADSVLTPPPKPEPGTLRGAAREHGRKPEGDGGPPGSQVRTSSSAVTIAASILGLPGGVSARAPISAQGTSGTAPRREEVRTSSSAVTIAASAAPSILALPGGVAASSSSSSRKGRAPILAKRTSRTAPRREEARALMALSGIGKASLGSRIDVEAVVESVGELRQKMLRSKPGASVQMRKFVLRDGAVSSLWTVCGKQAKSFGRSMKDKRIVVRGAKVHHFNKGRHLSGCLRVDVCMAASQFFPD